MKYRKGVCSGKRDGIYIRSVPFPTPCDLYGERSMVSAASVGASTVSVQETGPGATPRAALQGLHVRPIPLRVAKELLVKEHYLHNVPGGTHLPFGVFLGLRLMGALTFGCGPANAHRLLEGASPDDCATLTRLWLSDLLPRNSESRILGVVTRALRTNTSLKFLVTYADPARGHTGTIYQAANWIYTGLSDATPLYSLAGGVPRHSRSFSHSFGTRSQRHFRTHGIHIELVPQQPKLRYLYFLDPRWKSRLRVPVLPYPKAIR